jgi:hypothetical protein
MSSATSAGVDAEVVDDDVQAIAAHWLDRCGLVGGVPQVGARFRCRERLQPVRLRAGDHRGEILLVESRPGEGALFELGGGAGAGGENAALGALLAQPAGQGARVHLAQSRDLPAFEVGMQRLGAAPIARPRQAADYEAGHLRAGGLLVERADAVVADLWCGHHDDLAGLPGSPTCRC